MMENLVIGFVDEATELLEDLEKALLKLEQDKHSKEGIGKHVRVRFYE